MTEDKPEECESCQYETNKLKAYSMHRNFPKEEESKWLCLICASTTAGNAYEYPEQYPERNVLQMIAFVGNMILDRIGKEKP